MERINYDKYNEIFEKEIAEFNKKYKNVLIDLGYNSILDFLHHITQNLRKYKFTFEKIASYFDKYDIEVYKDFLKNLYLMIMAYKMEIHFTSEYYNCYNMESENFYDMKLFIKKEGKELELFRFLYDQDNNKNKLDLIFYDDRINYYEIHKAEEDLVLCNRSVQAHNAEMRSDYLLGYSVSHNYFSITPCSDLLDSMYEKFYSDNDKSELLVCRKKIIRDALIELNCYDTHIFGSGKSDETGKRLIKSYPWLDIYSKQKQLHK